MNKITPLETKCLANMPVVLDTIVTTIDTLSEILNPQYDRIEECLTEFFDTHKKLRYQHEDGNEKGYIYIFTDHIDKIKKRYLFNLSPILDLYYCLNFGKAVKNGVSFYVQFGYYTDGENYNEVYFGLGETDSAQYLTDEWIEKIKTESRGRLGDLYGKQLYRISDNARRSIDGRKDRPLRGRFQKPHLETFIGTIAINFDQYKRYEEIIFSRAYRYRGARVLFERRSR